MGPGASAPQSRAHMLPTVAIVGRTNVGKSTLFNRLLKQNKALTHDRPGVTRDRIYGEVRAIARPFALVDTGGLNPESREDVDQAVFDQAREAMEESSLILLVVDGRIGLTPLDEELAGFVRKSNKPMLLVVNKVDGAELEERFLAEFHALGLDLVGVSAAHGFGMPRLQEEIERLLPEPKEGPCEGEPLPGLRIGLLGRPNVGKSSMINAFIGEKRLIVASEAGTTRDSVDVVLEKESSRYVFVDTAGVRRKSRVRDSLERFSVLRALKTSQRVHVSVLVMEADRGVTTQDKKLLDYLNREKVPFIVAVNKVDLVPPKKRSQLKRFFAQELAFCSHVPVVYTSSVTKSGLGGMLPLCERLWNETSKRITTGELNRGLQAALSSYQPPMVKNRRPKFYYLTQVDTVPPTFVFFMNDHTLMKHQYTKYLERQIRKLFGLHIAPIQLIFRTSEG